MNSKYIIGVDEAGRGPLAGPVFACAVALPLFSSSLSPVLEKLQAIKDSKLLSPAKREYYYDFLIKEPAIKSAVSCISPRVIDRINIHQATLSAMQRSVRKIKPRSSVPVYIDGIHSIPNLPNPQTPIIKGDRFHTAIIAASIIAKVRRDHLMLSYHRRYPKYRFDLHKGYGTKVHLESLTKHGPCPIHRLSFRPIKLST